MSYPNLGLFAESLRCELCEGLEPENDLDLDLDWEDYDRLFGDENDWDDWAPPEEPGGNWWGDWEPPDVYPTVEPTDGGWIFGVGGRF